MIAPGFESLDFDMGRLALIKKHFAFLLSATLLVASVSLATTTHGQSVTSDQAAEKLRSDVQKLRVNHDKIVEVRLRDKTKVKGYVTNVETDSFTVRDSKTATMHTFSYSDVVAEKSRRWFVHEDVFNSRRSCSRSCDYVDCGETRRLRWWCPDAWYLLRSTTRSKALLAHS
jgi:hypothetical protein